MVLAEVCSGCLVIEEATRHSSYQVMSELPLPECMSASVRTPFLPALSFSAVRGRIALPLSQRRVRSILNFN